MARQPKAPITPLPVRTDVHTKPDQQDLPVPILNDAAMEADEAFSVVLTASDTASLATPSTEP